MAQPMMRCVNGSLSSRLLNRLLRVLCASVSSVFKETPRVRLHGIDGRCWEAASDTEDTEAQRHRETQGNFVISRSTNSTHSTTCRTLHRLRLRRRGLNYRPAVFLLPLNVVFFFYAVFVAREWCR